MNNLTTLIELSKIETKNNYYNSITNINKKTKDIIPNKNIDFLNMISFVLKLLKNDPK
jgi:hypothetical protein